MKRLLLLSLFAFPIFAMQNKPESKLIDYAATAGITYTALKSSSVVGIVSGGCCTLSWPVTLTVPGLALGGKYAYDRFTTNSQDKLTTNAQDKLTTNAQGK